MPVPKDIISLIVHNRPLSDYTPPKGRTTFPSEIEIDEVSKIVSNLRKEHEQSKKINADEMNLNYSHWERTPDVIKKSIVSSLFSIKQHGTRT